MFLTLSARTKLDELCRTLATPEQVEAAILRLHQHRQRSWPRHKAERPVPPDAVRELAAIHAVLVVGDDVIISAGSLQAASISAAMCSLASVPKSTPPQPTR